MEEIWKDIPGYEGSYQVSNIGNVKSIGRHVRIGKYTRFVEERMLSVFINYAGYPSVGLFQRQAPVHRLIALAFIPNPENKRCINHKDGIKINNQISNLEWCTHKENTRHAFNTGLMPKTRWMVGKYGYYNASITPISCYDKNGEYLLDYNCIRDAERITGISYGNIRKCLNDDLKTAGGFIWRFKKEKI